MMIKPDVNDEANFPFSWLFVEINIRERIAKDIEKLLDHREEFCDDYNEAIMRAAECVRFPNE